MAYRLRALLPLLFLIVAAKQGTAQCSLNPPLFLGNDTLVCEGHFLNAGIGYVSYTWHNSSSGQTFAADVTGQKHVTVTDSFGCTGSDTINLIVRARPLAIVSPSTGSLICEGETVELHAWDPGTYAYLWNDSTTSSDKTIDTSGNFFVIVFDTLGCTDTSQVISFLWAPKPIISFMPGGPYEICTGDTLFLNTFNPGHYAYLWSDSLTSANRQFITSGSYSVVVYDSTGCTDTSDVFAVTVNPKPIVTLGPDTNFCAGDTIVIGPGSGFNTYFWSVNASSPTIPVTAGGGYWIEVSDSNACYARDSIYINEWMSPYVDLGNDTVLCGGMGSIVLDAGAGFTAYLWSNSETTQTTSITLAGMYFVQVTGVNGCVASSNIITITDDTTSNPPITFSNLQLSTSVYTTYQWYLNGTAISGANAATYDPLVGGDYFVAITTASGCMLYSDTLLVVLEITKEMIPQGFSPNADGINDNFEIPGMTAFPNSELIVFNRYGSEVFSAKPYTNNWNGQNNNGGDLEEGTYFYKLDLGNNKDNFSGYIMIRR